MRWNHLPVAGGIYDQHPEVLEKFRYIFSAQAKKDAADRRKQEFEAKQAAAKAKRKR